jgi:hypothetical protein
MRIRDKIDRKLEPNCRTDEHFGIYCNKYGTFTKSDILELFETLRAQMPVADDLIKEEYRKHAVSLEGRLREDTDGSIGSAKNRFNLLSFLTLYVKSVYPIGLTYEK